MASNLEGLSLDSAVKLLTSTMRDPMNSNVCVLRLSVAADRIDQALEACTTTGEKTKFAKSYPELLRAGINFLTNKRSSPDRLAMMKNLVQCRCNFGSGKAGARMRRLHQHSRDRVDGRVEVTLNDLLFDAVTTVSQCLILALTDQTQHKFRAGNANSGEPRWPQGPEDLLPHGPKDSLDGLEFWVADVPHGYIIFKLAGRLALFYVPFSQEIFRSPDRFILGWPFRHLKKAINFYDEGDSSPLARIHFFTYPVKAIFEFFNDLMECDAPEFNKKITALRWITPVLARLTTILSMLPMEWSSTRSILQHFTAYANAEIDRETGTVGILFKRELMTELPHMNILNIALEVMVDARKTGCWNIACPSTSEVIHSRLCSGCNLIRFCGEQCQKEAWKRDPLPHKDICAKIRSVKDSLGVDNWPLLWTSDFTFEQFQAMCDAKTVDKEAVKAIGITIYNLRYCRNGFQADAKEAARGISQTDILERRNQRRLGLQNMFGDLVGPSTPILGQEEVVSMMSRHCG